MTSSKTKFSLQEFLVMPDSGDPSELIDGEIVPKVSPKYKQSNESRYT
jgi:Uma2 family endonuclease